MRYLFFFLLIIVSGILQVTLLDYFKIFWVKPDLLLISMVMANLIFERRPAFALSIFAGIIKDILGPNTFGINTILFSMASFLIIRLSKKIPLDDNFIRMALIFIIGILNAVLMRLVFFPLVKLNISLGIFLKVTFLSSLYTALILPLILKITKPLISCPR